MAHLHWDPLTSTISCMFLATWIIVILFVGWCWKTIVPVDDHDEGWGSKPSGKVNRAGTLDATQINEFDFGIMKGDEEGGARKIGRPKSKRSLRSRKSAPPPHEPMPPVPTLDAEPIPRKPLPIAKTGVGEPVPLAPNRPNGVVGGNPSQKQHPLSQAAAHGQYLGEPDDGFAIGPPAGDANDPGESGLTARPNRGMSKREIRRVPSVSDRELGLGHEYAREDNILTAGLLQSATNKSKDPSFPAAKVDQSQTPKPGPPQLGSGKGPGLSIPTSIAEKNEPDDVGLSPLRKGNGKGLATKDPIPNTVAPSQAGPGKGGQRTVYIADTFLGDVYVGNNHSQGK